MDTVSYDTGLEESERASAASLYYEAFRQKLGPILGTQGEALLAQTLNPDRALVARLDGKLVGIAGVEFGGKALVGVNWRALRRVYGVLSGSARLVALALFDRSAAPGELLMDGIVVAPEARGQGVGSALLEMVCDLARSEGFSQVRLDVVDTNPGAQRLYERRGFVATKTESLPWLRRWFGFGASTTMIKKIGRAP